MSNTEAALISELDQIASAYRVADLDIELYHYTSLTSLMSIIDHGAIWASSSFFLNDSKEVVHLEEFLHAVDLPRFRGHPFRLRTASANPVRTRPA